MQATVEQQKDQITQLQLNIEELAENHISNLMQIKFQHVDQMQELEKETAQMESEISMFKQKDSD